MFAGISLLPFLYLLSPEYLKYLPPSLVSVYTLTKPGKNIFAGVVELEEALCFFKARN